MKNLIIMMFVISSFLVAENKNTFVGNDLYEYGKSVRIEAGNIDDVFAAGGTVFLESEISGTGYFAGNVVIVEQDVENNLYAVGQNITINGVVGNDAIVVGGLILINNEIKEDLRAVGQEVFISKDIGGDVVVAASRLEIKGEISGSAVLIVEDLIFSPDAKIDGELTVYSDMENIEIPSSVISPNQVTFKTFDEYDHRSDGRSGNWIMGMIGCFAFIFIFILIFSFIFQKGIVQSYQAVESNFKQTMGKGFGTFSILLGCIVIGFVTIVGIPISILIFLLMIILSILSYFFGSYLLVLRFLNKNKEELSNSILSKVLVSALTTLVGILLINIPLLGWWASIAISLFGLGAMKSWKKEKLTA